MLTSLGTIAELLTWVGFGLGGALLVGYLFARAAQATWIHTDAVVVEGVEGTVLRWLSHERELYERPADASELGVIAGADHCRISYSRLSPWKARLEGERAGMRTLGILASVFLGVGVLATLVSVVLLLVEG